MRGFFVGWKDRVRSVLYALGMSAEARKRIPVPLVLFVGVYMVVFSGLALRAGNAEFAVYAGAMVVFIGLAAFLHLRFGLRRSTLWLLAVWGLLHMAGGTVAIPAEWADAGGSVLYSLRLHPLTPRYDQVVHAFGFFTASLACFDVLSRVVRHDAGQPRVGLAVASALMGCGLGSLNEVLEFAITLTVPDHNVGGYVNTGWDLVSNLIGACAAGVVIVVRRR